MSRGNHFRRVCCAGTQILCCDVNMHQWMHFAFHKIFNGSSEHTMPNKFKTKRIQYSISNVCLVSIYSFVWTCTRRPVIGDMWLVFQTQTLVNICKPVEIKRWSQKRQWKLSNSAIFIACPRIFPLAHNENRIEKTEKKWWAAGIKKRETWTVHTDKKNHSFLQ